MTSEELLAHFDLSLPSRLARDASPHGNRAFLSHKFPDWMQLCTNGQRGAQPCVGTQEIQTVFTWTVYVVDRSPAPYLNFQPKERHSSNDGTTPAASLSRHSSVWHWIQGNQAAWHCWQIIMVAVTDVRQNHNSHTLSKCMKWPWKDGQHVVMQDSQHSQLSSGKTHWLTSSDSSQASYSSSIRPGLRSVQSALQQKQSWAGEVGADGGLLQHEESLHHKTAHMAHGYNENILAASGIGKQIKGLTSSCSGCQEIQNVPPQPLLHPRQWPSSP